MRRLIAVAMAMFIFTVSPSLADITATKGGLLNNGTFTLLTTDKYDTGIAYTPQCFSCHMPIEFSYGGTNAPSTRQITRTDVAHVINKLNLSDDVDIDGVNYLRNVTYNITEYQNVKCTDSINCTGDLVTVTRWRWEWTPLKASQVTLQKNKVYVIDLYGHRTPSLDSTKADIIPSFFGFNLTEFAWWDAGWSYCKNITVTRYNGADVVATNITGLRLTNSYEARIVNAACNGGGTEQNFTVKSSNVSTTSTDWLDVEFLAPATNTTWSIYYGNAAATDPAYKFLLFNPNMNTLSISASTDTAYDWHSDDTAKYSAGSGYLTMNAIDSSAYNTDQIQTQTDYSGYSNVTVFAEPYLTSAASSNEWATRFLACTGTHGTWVNTYFFGVVDTLAVYRFYTQSPSNDVNTAMILAYQTNASMKVWYGSNEAMFWANNGTTTYSKNLTGLGATCKYWGGWVDTTRSAVRYYQYKIYLGYVNPSLTGTPTVSLGSEESAPVSGSYPLWSSNSTSIPSNYSSSTPSVFNVTWSNSSSTMIVNGANVTGNFTGSNVNYPMTLISGTSISGVWSFNKTLGAGFYVWSSSAVSNDSLVNTTTLWNFTINKAAPSCSLSGVTNVTYETSTTASCSCTNPEGATVKLYRNGVDVTATENNSAIVFGVGSYSYVCNATSTGNYTSATTSSTLTIAKKTPTWTFTLPAYNNTIFGYGDTAKFDIILNIPTSVSSACTPPGCYGVYYRNSTESYKSVTSQFVNAWVNLTYWSGLNNTLPQAAYFMYANWSGNDNYTATNLTIGFNVSSAFSIPQVLDELTLTPIIFNLTIYNSTNTITQYNIMSYSGATTSGNVTLSISSTGYVPRNYYLWNLSESANSSVTGYLLPSSSGVYVTYWIYSNANPTGEPSTLLQFNRSFGGNNTIIAESLSDFEGKGTVFLDPYAYYSINASKGSLVWSNTSYSPNPSFILRIAFNDAIPVANQSLLFKNVNYSMNPKDFFLRPTLTNVSLFNFTLSDSASLLEWYAMKLTYWNGTVLYFGNSTTATGGSITVNLNYSSLNGSVMVTTYMKRTNFSLYSYNYTYFVWYSHSAITDSVDYLTDSSGIGSPLQMLIVLFISYGVSLFINRLFRTGSGVVFCGVMTMIGGVFGIFTWQFLVGLWLLEVGFLMFREVY